MWKIAEQEVPCRNETRRFIALFTKVRLVYRVHCSECDNCRSVVIISEFDAFIMLITFCHVNYILPCFEILFLISNFRRVLNLVCILLGISPASDCGLPMFRNPLSVPSSRAGRKVLYIQPLKMELIESSETSANHNRTPGKYPKEYIQGSKY